MVYFLSALNQKVLADISPVRRKEGKKGLLLLGYFRGWGGLCLSFWTEIEYLYLNLIIEMCSCFVVEGLTANSSVFTGGASSR